MSVLQRLTEGVVQRNVQKEGEALLNKWEQTGLLEGLNEGQQKQGMAVLLENQAKELLREASSMAAGDVEGFAAVAFPIVRRVFGGLIANDLISVQPMSLPSGLIFFLDFTHESARGGAAAGESVYGGNVVARGLTGGVDLSGPAGRLGADGPGGHYDMGHRAAQATASVFLAIDSFAPADATTALGLVTDVSASLVSGLTEVQKKAIRYDADILADGGVVTILAHTGTVATLNAKIGSPIDEEALAAFGTDYSPAADRASTIVRRLTRVEGDKVIVVLHDKDGTAGLANQGFTSGSIGGGGAGIDEAMAFKFPIKDDLQPGNGLGSVIGQDVWGLEEPQPGTGNAGNSVGKNTIPEIDIKVDSIAVTAQTKKLKAKWSPELGQDLNAYHNLDAEVELTGILSEQIALEIDRELLGELVQGATAGTRYWSRAPGLFVDSNGAELGAQSAAPDFTGTVSEWYETLIETINDVSAQIHRKTLRGGANFVVCSPEVANILEFTSGFRASVTADQDRGTIGAVKAGSLSKKFDVYVDPYFLRNVILVGRKGSSFLESGFVYAPYVPLQVTPTIFGTEDFVPRKGVMTRYAKKMVRPDMYGLVVVRGLLGEEGKTAL